MDQVQAFFESGGKMPKAQAAPTTVSNDDGNDPVYTFLASGKVAPEMKQEVPPQRQPFALTAGKAVMKNLVETMPQGPAIEGVANAATGMAGSALGGIGGLLKYTFGRASGQDNETALAGANEFSQKIQNAVTYEPQTAGGQAVAKGLSLPAEGIAKVGQVAGQTAQDAGASPEAATAIDVGINAIPMVLGAKSGPKGKAPVKGIDYAQYEKPTFLRNQEKAGFVDKPTVAPEGQALPQPEQSRRAQVLSRVGIDEARSSAISGDAKAAASDFQQSKLDNAGGNKMRQVLDNEKQALQTHAENIVRESGGSLGLSEDNLHARGTSIAAPFDTIKNVLQKERKRLYEEADAAAGNQPSVKLDSLSEFLKKDSEFEGKSANGSLRKGINAYLREHKILQEDGTLAPITTKSAEGLRQYINDQWSPETSGLAGKIKGLIDKDVLDNPNASVYKPARDMHIKIKQMLENPTGISKLMDYDPRNPVNRAVPYEKIPDFVTRLPVDQFKHVIQVLDEAPPELRAEAQAAKAEIKAQFFNKVAAEGGKYKGQWNAQGVTKLLNDSKAKLELIATPEEIAKLQDLNEAGHILKLDTSYPGAAVQEHNLVTRGAMAGVRSAVAGAGAAIAGPIGAMVGDIAGSSVAKKIGDRASLKSAQERLTKISDMVKK